MSAVLTKIALVLHTIYYILTLFSLGDYGYEGVGYGKAFIFWMFAIIVAIPCIIFHFADAIVKITKNQSIFNIIKLFVIVFAVPLLLFVGGKLDVSSSIIWNTYFTVVFVLQVISLCKQER